MTTDTACISGGTSSGITTFLKAVERGALESASKRSNFGGFEGCESVIFYFYFCLEIFTGSFKGKETVHEITITAVVHAHCVCHYVFFIGRIDVI